MSDRLSEIRDGLFFIVGPHRGGTTLLQAMLSTHSGITIPPETGYFDQVWPRRTQLGSLSNPQNLARVGQFVNGPQCAVSDLGLAWEDVSTALTRTAGGYDDLFIVVLSLYAESRGKRRVGEKSPRHIFDAETKLNLFPKARFLCLMRDPRAVARSEMETSWGSKSVGRITRRWRRVAEEAHKLSQSLTPAQFCLIRYEDLVREPELKLRQICDFLGERFEPAMLDFHQRDATEQGFRPDEVWKHNTLRPVDPAKIDQWKNQLTLGQISLIESTADEWLDRMGYLKSDNRPTAWQQLTAWLTDRTRWGWEIVRGLLRGRNRRRPWNEVWKEITSNFRRDK